MPGHAGICRVWWWGRKAGTGWQVLIHEQMSRHFTSYLVGLESHSHPHPGDTGELLGLAADNLRWRNYDGRKKEY